MQNRGLGTISLLKCGLPAWAGPGAAACISVPAGPGLSIKGTQGNLWPLKEIPSPGLLVERWPFVHWHVSHTFQGQISLDSMKPGIIFGHCNVPVRAERI